MLASHHSGVSSTSEIIWNSGKASVLVPETLVKYFGNCFHKNTESVNLRRARQMNSRNYSKLGAGGVLIVVVGTAQSCVCDFGFGNSDSGISSSNRKPDNLKLGSQKANRD